MQFGFCQEHLAVHGIRMLVAELLLKTLWTAFGEDGGDIHCILPRNKLEGSITSHSPREVGKSSVLGGLSAIRF